MRVVTRARARVRERELLSDRASSVRASAQSDASPLLLRSRREPFSREPEARSFGARLTPSPNV